MKKYNSTNFKLAIIVGEQSRAVHFNIDNLTCFFNLLGIPYDFFVCTDKISHWKNIKNVKSLTMYQDIKRDDQNIYRRVTIPHMKRAGHQFIKSNHAIDTIKNNHSYTHMMKLRTDSIYLFNQLLRRVSHDNKVNKIEIKHVKHIRNILSLWLEQMHQRRSTYIAGDKFAIGSFDTMHTWFRAFVNPEIMKKVYKQNDGPDFTASNKIIKHTNITIQRGVNYNKQWYNPLNNFVLTRFANKSNNMSKFGSEKSNIGVRISKNINSVIWKNNQRTAEHISDLMK